MPTHRSIADALSDAAENRDSVVLATVVRVTGSSYGGVGARMVVKVDGSTVGLVSGGCLESDIAEHARRVHATKRAEVVRYDTRDDDDAPWGLGLGCNGLIDVLLEPLAANDARVLAAVMHAALSADSPSVLATVIVSGSDAGTPALGAHAVLAGTGARATGDWGDGHLLATIDTDASVANEALAAGRHGLVKQYGATELAFEVIVPTVRIVVCGTGPDAFPIVSSASQLGWEVIVASHLQLSDDRTSRFPGARVVECAEARALAEAVRLTPATAAVVVSHNFPRDLDYVHALLVANVAYIGVLGPRARTQRMLDELANRGIERAVVGHSLFAPVGLDIGGDGPQEIALAIVAEVAAVMNGRSGGHLRDRRGPLHEPRPSVASVDAGTARSAHHA